VLTERDATYTLDETLGNTTELPIAEHTTDSHGRTLLFALFDLVGLRLSPRIAKLTEKHLWRPRPASHYTRWRRAGPLLDHHAQVDLIGEYWDDLLRSGGSLKLGHVSASLLVSRLQAGARQHPLAKALVEHGKLLRTLHALRWFTDEAFRRRIGRQLNRGEALNDLRRFLSFAHRGHVRHRHHDDQTMQAHCLTLVSNACVLATTSYLQDAIDAHRADGQTISEEAIAHLSPARFGQINPYGTYTIDVKAVTTRPREARSISDEDVERVIVKTLEETPPDATHWSMVDGGGSGHEPGRQSDLAGVRAQAAPDRVVQVSPDPQSIDKVRDIVGLYLNPPDAAVVLCVDEKSQIQALDRTAPILPLMPGVPQRRTHDSSATASRTSTRPWTWPPGT
jgi:hypothetical protein